MADAMSFWVWVLLTAYPMKIPKTIRKMCLLI